MKVLRDAEVVAGLTLEAPFRGVPAVTHCGEALCSRNHRLPAHRHRGIELMYLVSGSVTWEIGGRRLRQRAGELCAVGAGRWHATARVAHPEFKALYAGLDLQGAGRAAAPLREALARRGAVNFGPVPEAEAVLRGLFQQALAEQAAPSVARKFAELLAAIAAAALRPAPPARRGPSSVRVFSPPVQRALNHLRHHTARRVPVEELARVAHLSPAHFAARFRREVGSPPAAYHRRLRLETAREALRTPDAPVLEAAVALGFSSSQHFSTLFRQAFGCTPRQWKGRRDVPATRQPV